jgi:hypothetical protein
MPVFNITVYALLVGAFWVFFLPVEKLVKSVVHIEVARSAVSLGIVLCVIGLLVHQTALAGMVYLLAFALCLGAFGLGLLVDRKYPYMLALVFVTLCPVLLILKLNRLAELSAVLCYLCLILGITKDIFHTKLVTGATHA